MVYPFFRMESYVSHGKRIAWEAYRTGSVSHGKLRSAREAYRMGNVPHGKQRTTCIIDSAVRDDPASNRQLPGS